MKKLVKLTALMMVIICGLSLYLIKTDFWFIALVSMAVALFWLASFVDANLPGWVK